MLKCKSEIFESLKGSLERRSPQSRHRVGLCVRLFPRLCDLFDNALVEIDQRIEPRESLFVAAHFGAPRLAELADWARRPAELGGEDGGVELLPELSLV